MKMGRALVIRSIEDETGQRCVDVRREADGTFSWAEFRRDPEEAYGWWPLRPTGAGFGDARTAEVAARGTVGWVAR